MAFLLCGYVLWMAFELQCFGLRSGEAIGFLVSGSAEAQRLCWRKLEPEKSAAPIFSFRAPSSGVAWRGVAWRGVAWRGVAPS